MIKQEQYAADSTTARGRILIRRGRWIMLLWLLVISLLQTMEMKSTLKCYPSGPEGISHTHTHTHTEHLDIPEVMSQG